MGGCAGITYPATLSVQRFNPFLGDMDSELLGYFSAQGRGDKAGEQGEGDVSEEGLGSWLL